MTFDLSKVYTSVNADELQEGDKVIVADTLSYLRRKVADGNDIGVLKIIRDDNCTARFGIEGGCFDLLAYLVERKENCTNRFFKDNPICNKSKWPEEEVKLFRCEYYQPKTEQKAEKKYRPFRDTDELIKTWGEKVNWGVRALINNIRSLPEELNMPHIWVRKKLNFSGLKGELITRFEDSYVDVNGRTTPLHCLFTEYEFLDGSPCGVEVC